ncbi:MAG: hypothetical protein Q4G19_07045 [Clostridia bacterium]|nr:hypothetical protein [Clostridia bacterium]
MKERYVKATVEIEEFEEDIVTESMIDCGGKQTKACGQSGHGSCSDKVTKSTPSSFTDPLNSMFYNGIGW